MLDFSARGAALSGGAWIVMRINFAKWTSIIVSLRMVGSFLRGRPLGILSIAVTLALLVHAACGSEDSDRTMLELARKRGCLSCHSLQDDNAVAAAPPAAPSFREIAKRYKGDKDAHARLVTTVLQGTGSHPGDRHWAGKVGFTRMLPNASEIDPREARTLVSWILTLDK